MKIIIVLSNEFDELLQINSTTKLRANHVSSIYKTGDKIITLGWNGKFKTKSISHKVKDYIVSHIGLPEESIISIPDSKDTVGDAFYTREYIEINGLINNDIHVITSDWHLKRVKFIFETSLPNVKISFHGIETPNGDLKKENDSLEKFKQTFDKVDFSNLKNFKKILLKKHPMYNNKIV